jgi:hypothetical protein
MSCKEVARLVSESKDHDLTWRQRMSMRFHLMMCRMCRLYQSNLEMLSRIARQAGDLVISRPVSDATLPETAKRRIKDRLSHPE